MEFCTSFGIHSTIRASEGFIYPCLSEKNIREIIDEKTHVQNGKATKNELNRKIASGICPQCGGNLVKRSGKYGSFYGCSNYPKCRFTTNL